MKENLEKLGFTITSEEIKPYGFYYKGFLKYRTTYKIEIYVAKTRDNRNIFVKLSDSHFKGNVNGYVENIEDIKPIIDFMMRNPNK